MYKCHPIEMHLEQLWNIFWNDTYNELIELIRTSFTQIFVSIRYLRILTRLLSNLILNFHGSLSTKPLSNKKPIRITWDVEGLNQTGIDKSNTKVDNPYHLFPLNWRSIKGFISNRKPCIIHSEIYRHPFFILLKQKLF